jgi:hypothetical protein
MRPFLMAADRINDSLTFDYPDCDKIHMYDL